jgi:DnaJ-class molecular chaperone
MANRVRCWCYGDARCKLCGGTGFYEYTPGEAGWMPFRCPTCDGSRQMPGAGDARTKCVTCNGVGTVDPAKPAPLPGWKAVAKGGWKFLFGGG